MSRNWQKNENRRFTLLSWTPRAMLSILKQVYFELTWFIYSCYDKYFPHSYARYYLIIDLSMTWTFPEVNTQSIQDKTQWLEDIGGGEAVPPVKHSHASMKTWGPSQVHTWKMGHGGSLVVIPVPETQWQTDPQVSLASQLSLKFTSPGTMRDSYPSPSQEGGGDTTWVDKDRWERR